MKEHSPVPSRFEDPANYGPSQTPAFDDSADDDPLRGHIPRTAPLDMVISRIAESSSRSGKRRIDQLENVDSGRARSTMTGWESATYSRVDSPSPFVYPAEDPIVMGLCSDSQSREFFDRWVYVGIRLTVRYFEYSHISLPVFDPQRDTWEV
jgi:hypothetical protein